MKQYQTIKVGICIILLLPICPVVMACTDFILPFDPANPIIISGRTMDFSPSFFDTVIVKIPKGLYFSSDTPGDGSQNKGFPWTNEYGYVGLGFLPKGLDPSKTPISIQDIPVSEGMNTEGLSVGSLWLDYADFGDIPDAESCPNCINAQELMSYILGTCARVEDVIEKLKEVRAWVQDALADSTQIHLSIHDQNGKSLVVEYLDGEQRMYENDTVGVLTNEPSYEWQVTNYFFLYRNFSYQNSSQDQFGKFVKDSSGLYRLVSGGWQSEVLGSGLYGLPGDSTSPSRFIRAAALRNSFPPLTDNRQGVLYALQLLGRVAVCDWEVIMVGGKDTNPTLWRVVRDHSQKILYYSSRMDQNLKAIRLNALDFSEIGQATYTTLSEDQWFLDVTSSLTQNSPVLEFQEMDFSAFN